MKGKRKFRCAECKAESWFHWVERNRAKRLACTACGSLAVDPCSDEGKAEVASNLDGARERMGSTSPHVAFGTQNKFARNPDVEKLK